jgi:hypothetical protein
VPVTGTPVRPNPVTREQVRMFLRDRADYNLLLDHVQFTDRELDLAVEMAVSSYNCVTPVSYLTPQSFPPQFAYILLLGTTRFLLMSESFNQAKNQLTYQAGDIAPIGIDDKAQLYSQLANTIKAEWDELVRGQKTQANLEASYGTLGSGYAATSRFNKS